jgi:hypothetical protein
MAVRQVCPVGRHGGSHHGETTTDGNRGNAHEGIQEACQEIRIGPGQEQGTKAGSWPADGQDDGSDQAEPVR